MNHTVAMVLAWFPAVVGLWMATAPRADATGSDMRAIGVILVLAALVFFLIQGAM